MSNKNFTLKPDIVKNGLVAWYDVGYNSSASTCDVGAGVTWSELVNGTFSLGYANDASDKTITGAEFDGVAGHGFSFGGGGSADQHFAVGNTGIIDDVTTFTIEIWSKLKGPTGVSCGIISGQVDVSSSSKNDSVFSVRYASESGPAKYPSVDGVTNCIIVGLGDGSNVQTGKPIVQYESAGQVQSNEWQQIVYSIDVLDRECGGDNSGRTHSGQLYINGVKDIPTGKKLWGCASLSSQTLDEVAADLKVGVGELSTSDESAKNWHGEIGCVRFYNRVLSQEEIVQNYIGTHRRFPAPIPIHIPYYAHRGHSIGVLLSHAKGTLGEWNTNNQWWNMDLGGWSDTYYIGDDIFRVTKTQDPNAEIRLDVGSGYEGGNNTPPNTETFFEQYPNSFLRASINDVYYDLTVQQDTGNEEQFMWRSVSDLDWSLENIITNDGGTGGFGWLGTTEVELELWSGHTH